jgi:hypothetical protein
MRQILSIIFLGTVLLASTACDGGRQPKEESSSPAASPDNAGTKTEDTKASPWRISSTHNDLTGQLEITAVNGWGSEAIIIRQRGKTLDCYVTTGEFLETTDNMHTRRSLVKYKFDDGSIVRQTWILSDDNTALFYPGKPNSFLQKMRGAKRFVIEYSPSDKIPQTASFDVSSFPAELGLEKRKGR